MEGPTEKYKLIMALKVSGLRTALWDAREFLYKIESDFQSIFGRELAETTHTIGDFIYKCDDYLNNYVENYKGE